MHFLLVVVVSHIIIINADTDQIVVRKVEEVAVQNNHDNTVLLQYRSSLEVNSVIKQTVNYTKEDDKSILWKLLTQNGILATDSSDNREQETQKTVQRRTIRRGKRQAFPQVSTTATPFLTTTRRSANNGSQFWDGVKEGAKKVQKFVKQVGKQISKTFKDVFNGNDSNGGKQSKDELRNKSV